MTSGNDYPILRDIEDLFRQCCQTLQGGVIKPAAPVFIPTVVNEPDLLWRDNDLTLVQENDGDLIVIDNGGI